MATAFPLDLYLSRIQLHRADLLPSLELLQQLQQQHLRHIPFENIDVVVGKRISMQAQDVQAKLLCWGSEINDECQVPCGATAGACSMEQGSRRHNDVHAHGVESEVAAKQ